MIKVELSSPPQQVPAGGPRAGPGRTEDHDDADRPDRGLPLHRDPLHGHHRPPRPLHEVSTRAANEPLHCEEGQLSEGTGGFKNLC